MKLLDEKKEDVVKRLTEWHKENERNFPWRDTRDTYRIFCTEILLQQTNAEKVEQVYDEFFEKFPTVKTLSEAETGEVEEVIEKLGFHRRAERLINAASVMMSRFQGEVPEKENVIKQLPGVGIYTAAATACFAFNKESGLVDTNTVRILERIFGFESDRARSRTDPEVKKLLDQLVKGTDPREMNYALLDFGAEICTEKNPKCGECPVSDICQYYQEEIRENGI